jgi:hypothetical protein
MQTSTTELCDKVREKRRGTNRGRRRKMCEERLQVIVVVFV